MPAVRFAESAWGDLSGIVDNPVENWDAAQAVVYIDDIVKSKRRMDRLLNE